MSNIQKKNKAKIESLPNKLSDKEVYLSKNSKLYQSDLLFFQPKNSDSENFDVHRSFDPNSVVLNWYDSDLHLEIDTYDFCSAKAVSTEGFGYLWAGVRATYGSTRGKVNDWGKYFM